MKKLTFSLILVTSIFLMSMSLHTPTVDEELLRITKEYSTYHLYNNKDYWTLALCEPLRFPGTDGDSLHISKAGADKSPHGNRLYKLYVKDVERYRNTLQKQPEGQVLIKEVWNVREVVDRDSVFKELIPAQLNFKDQKFYTPTTRKQLFIMYKTKPSEENDEGWWYGIVDIEKGVDKAKVIESMKINRCIKCHQQNKLDRVFGMTD